MFSLSKDQGEASLDNYPWDLGCRQRREPGPRGAQPGREPRSERGGLSWDSFVVRFGRETGRSSGE